MASDLEIPIAYFAPNANIWYRLTLPVDATIPMNTMYKARYCEIHFCDEDQYDALPELPLEQKERLLQVRKLPDVPLPNATSVQCHLL